MVTKEQEETAETYRNKLIAIISNMDEKQKLRYYYKFISGNEEKE